MPAPHGLAAADQAAPAGARLNPSEAHMTDPQLFSLPTLISLQLTHNVPNGNRWRLHVVYSPGALQGARDDVYDDLTLLEALDTMRAALWTLGLA